MDKLKFKLTIAYDGAAYQGWQVQKIGTGVQEIIERALEKLFRQHIRLNSSSRTDTGVHALGMVAHFEVPKKDFKLPVRRLALSINAFLPEDIRVLKAARAHPDFQAQFHATGKQYRYSIWNHPAMNPLLRKQAWHFPVALDLKKMRAAAKMLVGKHDFKSFATTHSYEMESTVRTLRRVDIKKSGPLLTVIIEGDGFLYKMCRGIVGTLAQVGKGRFPPEQVKAMLEHKDRTVAGMNAPAQGLVLWKVFYEKAPRIAPSAKRQAPEKHQTAKSK